MLTTNDLTKEIYTALRTEGKTKSDIAQTYGFKNMYGLNKALKVLGVEVIPDMVEKPEFKKLGSVSFQEHSAAKKQVEDLLKKNQELHAELSEYDRLKMVMNGILHPNGDGPVNPSMCDIVAYVRSDWNKFNDQNINLQAQNAVLLSENKELVGQCNELTVKNIELISDIKELHGEDGELIHEDDSLPVFLGFNNGNKLEMFLPENMANKLMEDIQRPRSSRSICAKYVAGEFVAIDLQEVVAMRVSGLVDGDYIKPNFVQAHSNSIDERGRFKVECYCGAEYFADMYDGFREGRKKARCSGCGQEVFIDPQADKLIDPKDDREATLLTNRYPISNGIQKSQQPVQEPVHSNHTPSSSGEVAPVTDLRDIKNVGRGYKDPCQLFG